VNLLRELFGEAELLTQDPTPFPGVKIRKLNWEVLPTSETPWPRLRERRGPILDRLGEKHRPGCRAEERLALAPVGHIALL
jgi:hypothetical protein